MRYLKAFAVLSLALALAVPAYAETQNVKVSGSIDAYWFSRSEYDLRDGNDSGAVPVGTAPQANSHAGSATHRSDSDNFARTNTQVEVTADLTDNVSTVVNLVNQRDWNADQFETGATATVSEFGIDLDLAYVQMKEIFYSPLTLTVGRQDLWFGRGFVIGNNWRSWDANASTVADEYSVTTAFDAVRATLDFNPWTIDVVWSNVTENSPDNNDDIDLWIANVNYKFAEYNAVAELIWVSEFDRSTLAGAGGTRSNATHDLGGRVQFDPVAPLTLGAELHYQWGEYSTSLITPDRDREAWGADFFGTYRFDNPWKAEVTLEWVHFSGEDELTGAPTGGYGAWNGLYRGKYYTAYGDFREFTYATGDAVDQSAWTNMDTLQVKAGMKPMEDLWTEVSFSWFWTPEDVFSGASIRNEDIGWEVDVQAVYDYTEDVSFGFLAAWFVPGDFYNSPDDETATDLVSSVKVTF